MDMPLTELMNELQNVESGLKAKGYAYAGIGSSSDSKLKGKGGKKMKRANKKQGSNKKTKAGRKSKGKCFNCGEKGHWKKDCPKALAKKKQSAGASGEQKTQ
ncbi:Uncharacterized protein Adt_35038 [Abeliophyllum distichum]|uniref:CCHC-type domain-containing protein n=1 Tax=Abeliophyllum distichum TaxID=126358 RepID=A0ABD1QDK9_9LAMI